MTVPTNLATSSDTTLMTCEECGHPLDRHDAIGLRYCAATARGSMKRGCICAGAVTLAGELANY